MKISIAESSLRFPYEFDTFTISEAENPTKVEMSIGSTIILSTCLTPDANGNIAFNDMGNYISCRLEHIAKGGINTSPEFVITANEKELCRTSLIQCAARINATAEEVVNNCFLTTAVIGTKMIPADVKNERLAWYNVNQADTYNGVDIEATWVDIDNRQVLTTQQRILATEGEDNCYFSAANVAPYLMNPPHTAGAWMLVQYTAIRGARRMSYEIAPHGMGTQEVTQLCFLNIFGQMDSVYFFGRVTHVAKPTYTSARVGSMTCNYKTEIKQTWKAETSNLNDGELALVHDIMQAKQVWWNGRQVTLTDAEVKNTSEQHEQRTATLTWQLSTDGMTHEGMLPIRTFDMSFDKTFK